MQKIAGKQRIKLAILFGSYAKNNYTAFSDIDLLVVHENESQKLYNLLYNEMGLTNLEPHLYNFSDFRKIAMQNPRFIKELEGGICIFGDLKRVLEYADDE
ncbi:MAG: nucleotidyltransferase domain-containing protein [Candidatus Brockarchaeota archaeon]|nr:nucleotidyltransferase domain-containing protein [Candidatus Brockarchaeota archaeon]